MARGEAGCLWLQATCESTCVLIFFPLALSSGDICNYPAFTAVLFALLQAWHCDPAAQALEKTAGFAPAGLQGSEFVLSTFFTFSQKYFHLILKPKRGK